MNLLDVFLALLLVSAVVGGYRVGLVARLASWIGAVAGFILALRLAPLALRHFDGTAAIGRLFLTLAILLIGAAAGGAVGEVVGSNLRRAVPLGPARVLDHIGGGFVGIVGTLAALWMFLPVVADVPGQAARLARNSAILGAIQSAAPAPPDASRAVRALVGNAGIPDVFEEMRPAPDTGPPPSQVPVPGPVVERAVASTVKIESEGCGGLHEGSGFAAAADTVVTNAHVVAGGTRVRVRRPNGKMLRARVVVFDDNRDLAVLEVPGLNETALAVGPSPDGTQGAVLGHPGGQDEIRVAPASVRQNTVAVGRDIYGQDKTRRQVLFLAAALRPGDSGSPFIDKTGRVVGVAFAIAPDRPGTSYALADVELRAVLGLPHQPGAGGPCV